MRGPAKLRWRSAALLAVVVGAGTVLGGCLTATTPGEQVMGDEVYLLVGINLAIFFGFMALYSVMASRQRRGGTTLLEPGVKTGEAKQAQPPPENARMCATCGTANPPNQKFCTGCGFRLK